jgi:2-succinyl-5-enolpyruvyl-6-hydroxy-3-cyclohexene-1-carboxylate synthase
MLQWLCQGWILELREPSDLFWIGGTGPCPVSEEETKAIPARVWHPDFYDLGSLPPKSDWAVQISREHLRQKLSTTYQALTGLEVTTADQGLLNLPRHLVHWHSPDKSKFHAAVNQIQEKIQSGQMKKVVPVVSAWGWAATTDSNVFLIERLLHALSTSKGSGLRVYGYWSDTEGELGLTPEDLFIICDNELRTMAVAGTAPLNSDSNINVAHALESDPKERAEHAIVVEDLVSKLISFTGVSHLQVGTMQAVQFRKLLHLVTPITATISIDNLEHLVADLIQHLHPTPALGIAPRSVALSVLREIDDQLLASSRANFGAPFVVMSSDRVEAIVAIRQLRWKRTGSLNVVNSQDDRLKVEILSGCGIVAASQPGREWGELLAKRESVAEGLGLSREVPQPLGFAVRIIRELVAAGVYHFVVCAGARNAPLVVALESWKQFLSGSHQPKAPNSPLSVTPQICVESFFDERAAAFYALGVARSSGRPVAIVTTSGTAVTELHSAIAEADLSGFALIAVTADRPKRLRYSGAPQSLNQSGIFSHFVAGSLDLEESDSFVLPELFTDRPWHLNVCFEEPLLSDVKELDYIIEQEMARLVAQTRAQQSTVLAEHRSQVVQHARFLTPDPKKDVEVLKSSLERRSRLGGVAIVGRLSPEERPLVRAFLTATCMPCLLESPSGLRGDPALAETELRSGDRCLRTRIHAGRLGQVFRFGGIPTTRVWRDLDDPNVACVTTSISLSRFSGLGRGFQVQLASATELKKFLTSNLKPNVVNLMASENERSLLEEDRVGQVALENLLKALPHSEPGWIRALSQEVAKANLVYVGNSLPIRWWDWVATREVLQAVEANRGVNGIDGQISTALGLMRGLVAFDSSLGKSNLPDEQLGDKPEKMQAWIFVGDLTALYDLSAPWALNFAEMQNRWKVRIVVMNNLGGQIFKEVLKTAPTGSAAFENAHQIGFEEWAKMWGLAYLRLDHRSALVGEFNSLADFSVIEVRPSAEETAEFWKDCL